MLQLRTSHCYWLAILERFVLFVFLKCSLAVSFAGFSRLMLVHKSCCLAKTSFFFFVGWDCRTDKSISSACVYYANDSCVYRVSFLKFRV